MHKLFDKLNKPKTYLILMFLMIPIFYLGYHITSTASEISESPQFNYYSWRIVALSENGSPIDFSSFQITYYFDDKNGSLSMIPNSNLKELIIFFPENITKNISTEIMRLSNYSNVWEPLEVNSSRYLPKEKMLDISFEGNNSKDWIKLSFESDIHPNAKFSISKNSYWSDGKIYFNFGKDFECTIPHCAYNTLGLVESSIFDVHPVNTLKLTLVNQSADNLDPLYEFETSARSIKTLDSKNLRISLGSSIMTGAIFSFIAIFIGLLQLYPNKKK